MRAKPFTYASKAVSFFYRRGNRPVSEGNDVQVRRGLAEVAGGVATWRSDVGGAGGVGSGAGAEAKPGSGAGGDRTGSTGLV